MKENENPKWKREQRRQQNLDDRFRQDWEDEDEDDFFERKQKRRKKRGREDE